MVHIFLTVLFFVFMTPDVLLSAYTMYFLSLILQSGRNRGEIQEQREPSRGSAGHRGVEGYGFREGISRQETGGR